MKKIQVKYLVWLVFSFAFMISFFHRYSIGVLSQFLIEDLSLNATRLSLLSSLYYYAYGVMQIPCGLLVDSYGPRKIVFLGMLAATLGSAMLGIVEPLPLLYLSRLLIGLGASTVFTAICKIQVIWFKPNEFATMAGFTSVAGNIGGMLATTPLVLMAVMVGWRNVYLLLAGLTLLLSWVLFAFIQDYPSVQYVQDVVPGDTHSNPETPGMLMHRVVKIIKHPMTLINMLILFAVFGAYMSFFGLWGASYLSQVFHLTLQHASFLMMLFLFGILTGAPILGFLSDKTGRRNQILRISLAFLTINWILLVIVLPRYPIQWLIPILLYFLGFTSISPLLCFTNVKELHPVSHAGAAIGLVNIGPFFGAAFLNTLTARIVGHQITAAGLLQATNVYIGACLAAFVMSFLLKTDHPPT